MATSETKTPIISPESRRIATEQYGRANEVIASGDYDYAIKLLLSCCQLDPANLQYRQTLRRTQRAKFGNNPKSGGMSVLSTAKSRAKLKAARAASEHLRVLELGEVILSSSPWDVGVQLDMGDAAEALGWNDVALFFFATSRTQQPENLTVNRKLARLLEKRGDFSQAIILWKQVLEAAPDDQEADRKVKDLSASETIKRGGYQASATPSKTDTTVQKVIETQINTPPVDRLTKEAEVFIERIRQNPKDVQAYLSLASVYLRHQHPDRAKATLEEGLAATGQDYRIALELGELELEPYRKNLALAEKKLALPEEAWDHEQYTFEQIQKFHRKLVKEITIREMNLLKIKAEKFPQELIHRFDLGTKLLSLGMIDEAIQEFQQARRDPKLSAKASLQLGLCFKARNNWKLAQRNLEEALNQAQDEPTKKEILYQLACGFAEANDLNKAIELGSDLANIDFGYRQINRLLDEWQSRLDEA